MITIGGNRFVLIYGFIFVSILLQSPWVQLFRIDHVNQLLQSKSNSFFNNEVSLCNQKCSNSNQWIEYQSGQTYTYKVDLSTGLNRDTVLNNQDQSLPTKVRISAVIDLAVYQPCEMVLRIRQTQIDGIDDNQEVDMMKMQLERQSTHFAYDNGQIVDVCSEYDEPEWTINIKKSILSAIQMSAKSVEEKSSVIETDINGQCQTEYEPINELKYRSLTEKTLVMRKTKQLAKCNQRHQINLALFPRSYGLDEVIKSSMPMLNATYECRQKIQDQIVIEAECYEKQVFWPLNVIIDSNIRVQLIDQQTKLTVPKFNGQFKRSNLGWMTSYKQSNLINIGSSYSFNDVEQLLQQICNEVEDSIQIQVPRMFSELIRAKQSLSVNDEQQLYDLVKTGRMCRSPKIVDIFLDASALSGTEGSVEVLIQAYLQQRQQQISPKRFSYLFSLLAFVKNPTIEAAKRLVEFVQQHPQDEENFDQIVLGITGFIHNLRQNEQNKLLDNISQRKELETLVETIQQHLIEKLEQYVQNIPNVNVTTCLTLIHALKNIGLHLPSNYQQQDVLVQRLIKLVKIYNKPMYQDYTSIRVAILGSLVDVIDDQNRKYLLEDIFMNEQEPMVLRIEAYKTVVMSNVKISELEKIKNYIDSVENHYEDLVNYVRSHQANLRSTSDIHRRSVLPLGAPKFRLPSSGITKSRNYELSYLNDVYQVGVTVEADVIFDDNKNKPYSRSNKPLISVPQVMSFNLTVPIMGKEFQVVEVRIEQANLEQVLIEKLQQYSSRYQDNKNVMDPMTILSQLIDVVSQERQQILEQHPQLRLLIQVAVDGKTMVLWDQHDLVSFWNSNEQIIEFFKNLFNYGRRQVSIDHAFSFIPIDFVASMTTSNGLPVQVHVNSSLVLGWKSEVNVNMVEGQNSVVEFAIWPSMAAEYEARVQYYTGRQVKSIHHVARIYSAPQVNLMAQLNHQNDISFKWTMPEEQYTLIRLESSFHVNEQIAIKQNDRSAIESSRTGNGLRHQRQCTDFTKKPLGVALCYEISYENEPQRNYFVAQITMEKFDQQLNSFEIQLDNPLPLLQSISGQLFTDFSDSYSFSNRKINEAKSLKFVFNTPGSQIDRELAFELQLPIFDRESGLLKEARLRIQSPWKQIMAQVIANNQDHERIINVELTIDNLQYFQMNLGLELMKRVQKMEYHTKMILALPVIMPRPINLAGIWSYQRGPKSVLFVSLQDVQQKRNYIKATLMKTELDHDDLKSSVHCVLDLVGIAAQITGIFERSKRDWKLNFNTDYDVSSRHHSAQLTLKHQNHSWGKMIKLINQGSWSWTQFPQFDLQYNHHVTYGSNEFLEHDLQLGWNNDNERIRAYQMVKIVGQRGRYNVDSQTILVFKPLEINYELKTQSNLLGFGLDNEKRYNLIAIGHSRGEPENNKIRAEISYLQQSQKPLKMNLRAVLKSETIDFIYNDDIEEQQPKNYIGHLLVQLSPERRYEADYVYSIQNSRSNDYNHQVDMTVNDAITKNLVAKHRGQLRFIPNRLLDVQSKWTGENDQDLFDGKLKLDRYGSSECEFQHYPSDTKTKVYLDSYSNPRLSQVEFKNRDWKHTSFLQYDNRLKLNSNTKYQDKTIANIDGKYNQGEEYYLRVKTPSISTGFSADTNEKGNKYEVEFENNKLNHQTILNYNPEAIQFESKTLKDGKNTGTLKYNSDSNQMYQLKLDSDDLIQAKAECNLQSNEPYANVGFSWLPDSLLEHQTQIRGNRREQSVSIDSKTKLSGEKLAQIKAAIAKNPVDKDTISYANLAIDIPQFDANIDYEKPTYDEGKILFGFDGKTLQPDLKHRTQLKIKKRSIVDFESKLEKDKSNYLIEGQYRHADEEQPSNFNIKLGQMLQTTGKFNLFDKQEKQFDMAGNYWNREGKQYKHEAKIRFWPVEGSMKFDSKIGNEMGQNVATIKSFLSKNTDDTSYLQMDSDTKQFPWTKIEVNPRKKRAAIDINMDPIQHRTLFYDDNTAVKVNTITTKNQENVFNLNSEVNRQPMAKSHVEIHVGPQYRSAFHVYPEKQAGVFFLQTPSIKHNTEIDWNDQVDQTSTIKSTTHYQDDLFADLDARLEGLGGENIIKANVPSLVRLDSMVNVPEKRVSFDAQLDQIKRHVMGSMHVSNTRRHSDRTEGREFHFDLAWDVDRDPRSRILMDVNIKHQPDHSMVTVVQMDYAHNKLTFGLELTPRNVLANSALASLSYVPFDGVDSWKLVYTHLNHWPQVECKLEFWFHDEIKYLIRSTTQITDRRFVFGFQVTSPQNIDAQINFNLMGVVQEEGQYYLKATFQRAVEDQYEIEATLNRNVDDQTFFGKVQLHWIRSETQTIEYLVDLAEYKVSVHMVNPQNGRHLQLSGVLQKQDAQLILKLDVPYFPVIDGKIIYVPEEFYIKLNVDNERLIEAQYKQKGFDSIGSGGLYFLAKWQSIWTPSFELTAQSSQQNNQDLIITVEGKYNVEKVIYVQFKRMNQISGKKSSFFMEGWLSRPNGVRLFKTVSEFIIGDENEDMIKYMLNIEPNQNELETIEPIYVLITGKREFGKWNKMIGSIKISLGQTKRDWIDTDLVVENIRPIYEIWVPERIEAIVRYVPTSRQATLVISIMEHLNEPVLKSYPQRILTLFDEQNIQPQLNNLRVVGKYRNQFLITLDDRKVGFEMVSTKLGLHNTYEHLLTLYSPQSNGRWIQYRAAYHYKPETFTYFYRNELKFGSGYEQNELIYKSSIVFAPIVNKPTSYLFYYDLHSHILFDNDHVSARVFFFGPENKYQGVVATLRINRNDQITFEATSRIEEQSNQLSYYGENNKVVYFNMTLYTEDQTINTGIDGKVSHSEFLLNWHHYNRFGKLHSGLYKFKLDNDRFEVVLEHENHGYVAKGEFRSKQGVWIADVVVDEHEKVFIPQRLNRHSNNHLKQLKEQYKIHVESKEQCVQVEIEQQQQQNTQQLSLCLDMDQSNILNLAVDSIENGQKTTDLNIRLDTREVVNSIILSLKWNPEYQKTFLGRLLKQAMSTYNHNEIVNEVEHLVRVLERKLTQNNHQQNRYEIFIDELMQVVQDFGINVDEIGQIVNEMLLKHVWYGVEKMIESMHEYTIMMDQVTDFMWQVIRMMENQCYNNDVCRNVVHSFLSIDSSEKLITFISDRIVTLLQHTHRIISTSYAGRWIRNMMPSTVIDYVPDIIHHVNHYLVNVYVKMVYGSPLAEFMENIQHVLHEMIKATHWRSVQWDQVQMAVNKIMAKTLWPMRFISSTRVLVYDPHQGQLQIELYGPAVQHPRYYQSKYNDIVKHANHNGLFPYSVFVVRKRRSISSSIDNENKTESLTNKGLKLSSAWVELMLARNQFDNYSIPFRIVTEELNYETLTTRKYLQLFLLDIDQNHLINMTLIEGKEMRINFNNLLLEIGSDLKWTVKNSDSWQSIDLIRIVGNTIEIKLSQTQHLLVKQIESFSLKFSWTPQFQSIAIETELNVNHENPPDFISFIIESYGRTEQEGPLMFGETSMLDLIDDVFPDEPFFSASNLSTLIRKDMNLRQSLCYHWLMYYRINHTLSERLTCHRIVNLCNLIAHFVRQKQLFRTPNHCLQCDIIKTAHNSTQETKIQPKVRFGSRRIVNLVDEAEVIFLLDGACHQLSSPKSTIRFMLQLNRLSKVIERQFRMHQIKTRFMILTPNIDGQYEPILARSEPRFSFNHLVKFQSRYLKSQHHNLNEVWNETIFRESLWNPNGRHSLDFLYSYPYSPRKTSRHFIMIDCAHLTNSSDHQFTCQENDIDFITARNVFLQSNNYLHIITGIGLAQRSFSSPKMRRIIGIDWQQVMFDNQITQATVSMNTSIISTGDHWSRKRTDDRHHLSQWLRQHMLPHRDICHVLALETNGTVFNHRALKQANRKIFAQRLVANHQIHICQQCDCTLAKDFLVAQQECFLCQARNHTLMNPYQRIRDQSIDDHNEWPFNSPQVWTDSDEKEFMETEDSDYSDKTMNKRTISKDS